PPLHARPNTQKTTSYRLKTRFATAPAFSIRQPNTELARRLDDPGSIKLERRDAGQPAAAVGVVGAGGPTDHADQREAPGILLIDRRAGIAGAAAEARLLVGGRRIDQAQLQRTRMLGRDRAPRPQRRRGAADAAHPEPDAVH